MTVFYQHQICCPSTELESIRKVQSDVAVNWVTLRPRYPGLSAPGTTVLFRSTPPLMRGSLLRPVSVKLRALCAGAFGHLSGHLPSARSQYTGREVSQLLSLHSCYFLPRPPRKTGCTRPNQSKPRALIPKGKRKSHHLSSRALEPSILLSPAPQNPLPKQSSRQAPHQLIANVNGRRPTIKTNPTL